ncbi:MAG: FAD-dependent monooxygenase [Planctomycetes bacterium]|nr:FAD-dependent monooxygenase [Planctomycetota bacterium]
MSKVEKPHFVIVGGGLGGALMANYLGRAGFETDVYEMRGDIRKHGAAGGRSINLALSHRGICALQRVGLADDVMKTAVAMPGRMIHGLDSSPVFQPYGTRRDQAIHSVSRGGLNALLLEAAEHYPTVRLHFERKCTDVDLDSGEVKLLDTATGDSTTVHGDIVVSADGAFSAVRSPMQKLDRFDYRQDYLAHGYKELTIPPGENGSFRLEKHALHIWPRRSFMMIALPNEDGSYTCTLFWPFAGPVSFDAVSTKEQLLQVFETYYPDAVGHMPTLVEDYFENPVGSLATIRCGPWYYRDRVVLLGDAAHAVVPFYGQGMNASFEDVLVLDECMQRHKPDWQRAFEAYYEARKKDVDALADLAIGNFVEMRDHTGSRRFLLRKKKERILHRLFPKWYIPLYTMATFTRMSYVAAVARARKQDTIVFWVAIAIFVILFGVVWTVLSSIARGSL